MIKTKDQVFGEPNCAVETERCLARVCKFQNPASRFQDSAIFCLRNSVGVSPVAALKARLKGPID